MYRVPMRNQFRRQVLVMPWKLEGINPHAKGKKLLLQSPPPFLDYPTDFSAFLSSSSPDMASTLDKPGMNKILIG